MVRVFFDMDCVLADFERGVREMCHMVTAYRAGRQDEAYDALMWERIGKISHFYDKLELMPGAKEMFDAVYGKYGPRCEILTGIPKERRGIATAGEDKISWTRRMLSPDVRVNIVYREQKPAYCTGKDCILIDDLESNIRDWEKTGGTGILFRSAEQTLTEMREKGLL